jgi:hypothetical protein
VILLNAGHFSLLHQANFGDQRYTSFRAQIP